MKQLKQLLLFSLISISATGLSQSKLSLLLTPSDSLNTNRTKTVGYTSVALYAGSIIGLNQIWYKGYERNSFHLFNDYGEWEHIDKIGHLAAAYQESYILFQLWKWTGVSRKKAAWLAVGTAYGFQATIEILDGFSAKWGFSLPDIAFNTLGAGAFLSQELLFQKQIFTVKYSYTQQNYPEEVITSIDNQNSMKLNQRADDLFGTGFFHTILKDYNGQNYWLSINLNSIIGSSSKLPDWLNLAIGYGANNMYSGYDNTWQKGESEYVLNPSTHPRYRQFYISLDADFLKIKFKKSGPRFMARLFNFVKVPSPTIELNTLGEVKLKLLYF